jgi:hypothetical protein
VDAETRGYFETLRDEIASMRGDIGSLQREMASMRIDVTAGFSVVDRRFEALDTKIDRTAADARRDFGVTMEGVRHHMQVLAEGVVMNAEALSRFRTEFIAEIHEIRQGR